MTPIALYRGVISARIKIAIHPLYSPPHFCQARKDLRWCPPRGIGLELRSSTKPRPSNRQNGAITVTVPVPEEEKEPLVIASEEEELLPVPVPPPPQPQPSSPA